MRIAITEFVKISDNTDKHLLIVCLFVCQVFRPTGEFFTHMEKHF